MGDIRIGVGDVDDEFGQVADGSVRAGADVDRDANGVSLGRKEVGLDDVMDADEVPVLGAHAVER